MNKGKKKEIAKKRKELSSRDKKNLKEIVRAFVYLFNKYDRDQSRLRTVEQQTLNEEREESSDIMTVISSQVKGSTTDDERIVISEALLHQYRNIPGGKREYLTSLIKSSSSEMQKKYSWLLKYWFRFMNVHDLKSKEPQQYVSQCKELIHEIKTNYWDEDKYEQWLPEDQKIYTNYLVDEARRLKLERAEMDKEVHLLASKLEQKKKEQEREREEEQFVYKTKEEVSDLMAQLAAAEHRSKSLSEENVSMQQQLAAERHKTQSLDRQNTNLTRANTNLMHRVGSIEEKIVELKQCTTKTQKLEQVVVKFGHSLNELINHNTVLIEVAHSLHVEKDNLTKKLALANEKLAQCRDPKKLSELFGLTLESNPAIGGLWEQMKRLKLQNSVSVFQENVLRVLIMAAGALNEKPGLLNELNQQCANCPSVSALVTPPPCSNCEFLKDFATRLLNLLFSCGGSIPENMQQDVQTLRAGGINYGGIDQSSAKTLPPYGTNMWQPPATRAGAAYNYENSEDDDYTTTSSSDEDDDIGFSFNGTKSNGSMGGMGRAGLDDEDLLPKKQSNNYSDATSLSPSSSFKTFGTSASSGSNSSSSSSSGSNSEMSKTKDKVTVSFKMPDLENTLKEGMQLNVPQATGNANRLALNRMMRPEIAKSFFGDSEKKVQSSVQALSSPRDNGGSPAPQKGLQETNETGAKEIVAEILRQRKAGRETNGDGKK